MEEIKNKGMNEILELTPNEKDWTGISFWSDLLEDYRNCKVGIHGQKGPCIEKRYGNWFPMFGNTTMPIGEIPGRIVGTVQSLYEFGRKSGYIKEDIARITAAEYWGI
jgi:hypothetical protein